MQKDGRLRIDLNLIAIRLILDYWELYFKFRLKQSHSPEDANVNRTVSEFEKKHPKILRLKSLPRNKCLQCLTGQNAELRKEVIRRSIL